MYLIETGGVEILLQRQPNQPLQRVAQLGPGEFFGEMAVLGDHHRTAAARTVGPTRLLTIHETALVRTLARFPPIADHLFRIMAERRGIIQILENARHTTTPPPQRRPSANPSPFRPVFPRPPRRAEQPIDPTGVCWKCSNRNDPEDRFCRDRGVRLLR